MVKQSDRHLPPEVAAKFLAAAHVRRLEPGQELFALGSAPNAMFGLLSGRVQVSIYSAQGQRFFAAQFGEGSWFGEAPLLDDEARAFHVEAVAATEVAVLPAEAFWKIVKQDPTALLAVTRLVCSRYRSALCWIEDACLKPLPARLATSLLGLAGSTRGEPGRINLSQEMLAFQLGVARQTVNRQLKDWERQGLLTLDYATVHLTDERELRRIAASTTRACNS